MQEYIPCKPRLFAYMEFMQGRFASRGLQHICLWEVIQMVYSSFEARIRQNSSPLNKAFVLRRLTERGFFTKRTSELGYSFRRELQVLIRNVFEL